MTIRFNMTFLDETVCVFQPYLHGERGIENPSFIVYETESGGIYLSLRRSYEWLRGRASFDG